MSPRKGKGSKSKTARSKNAGRKTATKSTRKRTETKAAPAELRGRRHIRLDEEALNRMSRPDIRAIASDRGYEFALSDNAPYIGRKALGALFMKAQDEDAFIEDDESGLRRVKGQPSDGDSSVYDITRGGGLTQSGGVSYGHTTDGSVPGPTPRAEPATGDHVEAEEARPDDVPKGEDKLAAIEEREKEGVKRNEEIRQAIKDGTYVPAAPGSPPSKPGEPPR